MTETQITKRQQTEAVKYDTARDIRKLLDEAKKTYKSLGGNCDAEDLEAEISELVFESE